jgi:HSP20 family protein
MMISLSLKLDPQKPGYYILGEANWLGAESPLSRAQVRSHAWRPPTDMYETEDAIVIRVEIAGLNEQDFAIQLEGRNLSIRGVRSDPPERRAYYQMEIRFGEFLSEMELPAPVIPEEVEATYREGFLRIALPKIQPKHFKVE